MKNNYGKNHANQCLNHNTLTVLHLSMFPVSIFRASMTMRAAMTAFVVAIAGMMFPAIAGNQKGQRR